MVGVFSRQWVEPLAHVLKNLAPTAPMWCTAPTPRRDYHCGRPRWRRWSTAVRTFEIDPESLALRASTRSAARRRCRDQRGALKAVLEGRKSAYRCCGAQRGRRLVVAAKVETLPTA